MRTLLLTLTLLLGARTLTAQPGADARELAAVRAVWDEAVAAFVAKDWARYAETWAKEPGLQVIHPPARDWIVGWETFEARYRAILNSAANWNFETRRFDAQLSPSRDAAWATIENVLTLNGAAQTSWQVAVFKKVEGSWKMVLGFSAPVPPAQP